MENTSIEYLVSEAERSNNIEIPMGHRSSKPMIGNTCSKADSYINETALSRLTVTPSTATETRSGTNGNKIQIPLSGTTINLRIQENSLENAGAIVTPSSTQLNEASSSLTSIAGNSLQNQQIIIKIQLAKMENGNEPQMASTIQNADAGGSSTIPAIAGSSLTDNLTTSTVNKNAQFVNVTFNGNFIYPSDGTNDLVSLSSGSSRTSQTAGGGIISMNNINDFNGRFAALKIQEDWEQQQMADITPEYCEILDDTTRSSTANSSGMTNELRSSDTSIIDTVSCVNGSRRSRTVRSSSSSGLSRRRCRDAFRRILEPSRNMSFNKSKKQNKKHSFEPMNEITDSPNTVLPGTTTRFNLTHTASQTQQSTYSTIAPPQAVPIRTATSSNDINPISIATVAAPSTCNSDNPINQVSATIWTPSQNDLIIPITSPPQFVVVQCPPTSVVTLGRIDYNSIRLSSKEIGHAAISNVNDFIGSNIPAEILVKQIHNGPIVHSQVDFVHCLVPDLEKIINSSFYWGKIDRYEAERLLEGKPEGTFLLRDSAQEEYLFSVTFRKFGRSLHARIEQSGHKFGFDCHDPSVFTAPTVTGLLQHYKDPTSVMFFEPMLTIPLHRKTTFSLQELARGVIVTNTTYDGINELGLPVRLKEFLKEYYYKQKLRVKPFDNMVYSCS